MNRTVRLVTSAAIAVAVVSLANAQSPPPVPTPARATPATVTKTAAKTSAQPRNQRRSIVQHYPYPYPEYYHGDQTAGFRNPGNAGRYGEYYPPGNQFQVTGDPVRVANFDRGGGAPDRAEQLQALQLGVQRDNVLMNHIDRYAAPRFGMGYFGGFY